MNQIINFLDRPYILGVATTRLIMCNTPFFLQNKVKISCDGLDIG